MHNADDVESSFVPVGILSRVSTLQQVEKVSLPQQEEACRKELLPEVSAREGGRPARVVETYQDRGVSGDGRDRDALTRALDDVKSGRIRYLLVYDVDRLTREPAQAGATLQLCEQRKVQLLFCRHSMTYGTNGKLEISSEIMYYVRSCFAKQERQQFLERTKRGRLGVAEKGLQPSRSTPPYGYHIYLKWEALAGRCRADEVGSYVPVPERAEVATDIFERMARRETLRGIAHSLQERGIPSPSGGIIWYPAIIQGIIRSTVYKGQAFFGKKETAEDVSREADGKRREYRIAVPRGMWKPISVPPIVSEDLWQAANDAMATNKQARSGDPAARFLFSGYMRCPLCGSAMSGRRTKQGTQNYYRCCRHYSILGRDTMDPDRPSCSMLYVRSSTIEPRIVAALAEASLNPSVVEAAVRDYLKYHLRAASSGASITDRARLLERREKVQNELRGYRRGMALELGEDESADVSSWRQDLAAAQARLNTIDTHLSALPEPRKISDELPEPSEAARRVARLLSRLPEAIKSPHMEVTEKRWLLDSVLLRIEPIEGAHGLRGAVDWSCKVTLRPDIWNNPGNVSDLGVRSSRGGMSPLHGPFGSPVSGFGGRAVPQLCSDNAPGYERRSYEAADHLDRGSFVLARPSTGGLR